MAYMEILSMAVCKLVFISDQYSENHDGITIFGRHLPCQHTRYDSWDI
jgi:hypothetical protein